MILKYPQSFCRNAGDNGCYVDCIIKAAFKQSGLPLNCQNLGKAYDIGIDGDYFTFDRMNYRSENSFYVTNPAGFFKALTGKKVSVRTETADYQCKKNEFEILFYTISTSNGEKGIGHFVFEEDTIQGSRTVAEGFVYSKRIFTLED